MVGGEGAALRLPERSGGSRKAALRELRWRLVFQGRVRSSVVVILPVFFAQDFCLQHGAEALPVQELVPKPAA